MPTVALASEFLDAFARIPRAQQKKVREFAEKFRSDPTSAAINYEKIHGVADDKVRTVRIDRKYRAVVLHPEQGDVHVLVWVDNHDEAMAWAARKRFEVNPATGALQVVNIEEAEQVAPPEDDESGRPGLLAACDDNLLMSFGVPAILLPAVRAVQGPEQLIVLGRHLPAEAAEALTWLGEGIPPEEVRAAVAVPARRRVDPNDLAASLEHPDTRRRFVTLRAEGDLEAMLDAPLEKWRVFLHPSQERLVARSFGGPARVLGGAGTGKTVVAMHRARHLVTRVFTGPDDRLLFTTYTANLALDVQENLGNLCGSERDRIDVVHLHAWAVRFLKARGIEVDIATEDDLERCWRLAIDHGGQAEFDPAFLRQEWDQVVLAGNLRSQSEYLRTSRTGRGRTLSRPQRGRAWAIFERYRQALAALGKQEWLGVIRQARMLLDDATQAPPYRAVIVDEAQDLHAEEWRLVRALAPAGTDDLFVVGDAHQRIYGRKVVLAQCGIAIQGRSSRLRINYRTTEQIRGWATTLLNGVEADDLDGDRDDARGDRSLLSGPTPEVSHFKTRPEEKEYLVEAIRGLLEARPPEEVCLVARTAKLIRDDYEPMLRAAGVPSVVLDRGREKSAGKVRLATMHRIKGLEFPVMILAGVNANVVPLRLPGLGDDPASRAEHEDRERSLLYVAATRARDRLLVTSWGTPSPFLSR